MSTKKNILRALLALCMVLALMPLPVAAAANQSDNTEDAEPTVSAAVMPGSATIAATNVATARMTLQQLQEKFPADKYWNGGNVDSYTNSPCPTHYETTAHCNHFTSDGKSASQCYGFALKLGWDAYGTSPRNWSYTKENSYVDSLKPGDIISSDSPNNHTVFVTGVTDTKVIVGECNWGENCIISWGRPIDKSQIKSWTIFKIYIAPSELPTGDAIAPAPTPSNNLLVASTNAVNINAGQSAPVNLTVNRSKKFTVHVDIADQSVCSGQWGSNSFRGSGSKWTNSISITGLKGGSTTVTLELYDVRSGELLDTEKVAVTVASSPQGSVQVETLQTLNAAGTASLYPTVFKGYLRGTDKYNAYSDSSGTNYIGRIYASDELKVQSVYAHNGELWMSALCPWDGYSSDRLIYAKLDAMVDTGFAPYSAIATSSAAVYTRSNAASKYGSLGKGDAVTIVGQAGQYVQVIYPLAAGGYKIGWCDAQYLSRPGISGVTAKSSSSAYFSYTLPSNAVNYLVAKDVNGNVLLRGNITGSGVSVNKMAQGATYYFYIESELSNGTGTVASAVKKVVLR